MRESEHLHSVDVETGADWEIGDKGTLQKFCLDRAVIIQVVKHWLVLKRLHQLHLIYESFVV